MVEKLPRSLNTAELERFWVADESPWASIIVLRLSGFFVPPQTSLYTFNIRPDDASRMSISTTMSKEGLRRVITVYHYTERYFKNDGYA